MNKSKRDSNGLNKRERAILKFIQSRLSLEGYSPTVREICDAVHLSSTATVQGYLKSLEERGYIVESTQKFYTTKEMINVPVVGKITAGAPILAVENITDSFPIPLDFVGNSDSFMLIVRGESMIEAGILSGDYILVKRQNTCCTHWRWSHS